MKERVNLRKFYREGFGTVCGISLSEMSSNGCKNAATAMLRETNLNQIEHGSQAAHRAALRQLGCDRIRLLQRQGIEWKHSDGMADKNGCPAAMLQYLQRRFS